VRSPHPLCTIRPLGIPNKVNAGRVGGVEQRMSDTKYWMAEPGGTPEGPYDLDTLRQLRDRGRITSNTQVCIDGGTSWQSAASVLGASPGASPGAAPGASHSPAAAVAPWAEPHANPNAGFQSGQRRPLSLAGPITATVVGALCSPCFSGLILGIISIVQASAANEALMRGNVTDFEQKSGVSRMCMIIAFVLSAFGCVLGIAWAIFVIAAGGIP